MRNCDRITFSRRKRQLLWTALLTGLSALPLSAAAGETDPATLAEKGRCIACHAVDEPRMGPSFNAIAKRYASQGEQLEALTARLRTGSSGVWGPAPMPPVLPAQLSDEELALLLNWILDSNRGS
jgi:cytochrome c